MIMTDSEFLDFVYKWASGNLANLGRVWPLEGGWEAWAQAEIAAYINGVDPTYSVEREALAYGDGRRADLLLNKGASLQSQDWIVVELKCQSIPSARNFVSGLNSDYYKLQEVSPTYTKSQKLTLGIFIDGGTEQTLNEQGYKTKSVSDEVGLAWYRV